jgi:hypothetical protein
MPKNSNAKNWNATRKGWREPLLAFVLVIDCQELTLGIDPQEPQSHNSSHKMPPRFCDAAKDKLERHQRYALTTAAAAFEIPRLRAQTRC